MYAEKIYDNFTEISRFSSIPFTLEYKYKIVCFMKRFGGRSIGISMAGFFFIKKNFLIRMMSGLYSEFSTLVQVTGIVGRKTCIVLHQSKTTSTNETII
ncbi:uncharacterized protein [Centruroides vittatus]|uniref:uncharacterized protein isoform X2 n=1 Tax=Centruroides vittatus TaxID=120091 RepID=UPI00350EA1B0